MLLDPADNMDRELLFCPHIYEWRERERLFSCVRPGDMFLDAGANIGVFSLQASSAVGPTGRVLAVEAEPGNAARLRLNIERNNVSNVCVANVGLSDRSETLKMGLNLSGNRAGHSFVATGEAAVSINCQPLCHIARSEGFSRIDVAKFDIEGFEFKVLRQFFKEASPEMIPRVILFEEHEDLRAVAGGSTSELLQANGYDVDHVFGLNYLARHRDREKVASA